MTNFFYPNNRILIFTKPPIAGKCKSRLIPALGKKGAAELQARLIKKIITDLSEFNLCPFEIWQSEPSSYFDKLFAEQKMTTRVCTQQGNNLGERMSNALEQSLQDTHSVVIIGSDCILYSKTYLHKAIVSLQTQQVVIGPALDGGYVLIGTNQHFPDLFEGINWGMDIVFEQTISKLQVGNKTYTILNSLWDIDTAEDLKSLRQCAPEILDF